MKFKHYGDAPWVFKGRALYQLQLVPVEEAKKYVPQELNLVSLFGYTLGGFYLARYDDSPVGKFDELVTIAGIVWNPPTSSAWAARVYVNNREARDHGVLRVGLPSRLVTFSEQQEQQRGEDRASVSSWPSQHQRKDPGVSSSSSGQQSQQQRRRAASRPAALASISWWKGSSSSPSSSAAAAAAAPHARRRGNAGVLASLTGAQSLHSAGGGRSKPSAGAAVGGGAGGDTVVVVESREGGRPWWAPWRGGGGRGLKGPVAHLHMPEPPAGWKGPRIPLTLPSFSGNTPEYPGLLYYACQLTTNVRVVRPLRVRVQRDDGGSEECMASVLGGRPLLAMAFNDMVMHVDEPIRWAKSQRRRSQQQLSAQPA